MDRQEKGRVGTPLALDFFILFVDEDNARLKAASFNAVETRVGNDNYLVTHHRETCGCAVETDDAGTCQSFYHVSRKAHAGIDIVDVDTLTRHPVSCSSELLAIGPRIARGWAPNFAHRDGQECVAVDTVRHEAINTITSANLLASRS
jgi:hypothetical protein